LEERNSLTLVLFFLTAYLPSWSVGLFISATPGQPGARLLGWRAGVCL